MDEKYIDNIKREALLITQEECAEVTQAISKIFRFGLLNSWPDGAKNNSEKLEEELGDLLCMIDILCEQGIVNMMKIVEASLNKRQKLKKWSALT